MLAQLPAHGGRAFPGKGTQPLHFSDPTGRRVRHGPEEARFPAPALQVTRDLRLHPGLKRAHPGLDAFREEDGVHGIGEAVDEVRAKLRIGEHLRQEHRRWIGRGDVRFQAQRDPEGRPVHALPVDVEGAVEILQDPPPLAIGAPGAPQERVVSGPVRVIQVDLREVVAQEVAEVDPGGHAVEPVALGQVTGLGVPGGAGRKRAGPPPQTPHRSPSCPGHPDRRRGGSPHLDPAAPAVCRAPSTGR